MRLQRFTNYLLSHRVIAFLLTLFITSLYVIPGTNLLTGSGEVIALLVNSITSLGMIYAALVTLVKGPGEGVIFTLAATVPYAIVAWLVNGPAGLLPTSMAGVYVISNILTWVFAVMLYKKVSWSQIIQIEALLGVFAVSVIHLIFPGVVDWWTNQILESLLQFKQMLVQYGWDQYLSVPPDMPALAAESAQTATGYTVTSILVVNIMQLVIARWWQSKVFSPGSFSLEMRNIRLSYYAGIAFIACFILLYFGNSVLADIKPVLITMFAIAGLSLMHYSFSLMPRTPGTIFWIVLIYTAIIFAVQVSAVLLAILALFDIWLDVRMRFKKV